MEYQETLNLINELEANPCLWDSSSNLYKNRVLKAKAIQSIALKLNQTGMFNNENHI